MPSEKFYIKKHAAWAPGIETERQWKEWANGKISIPADGGAAPDISFAPAMIRRRMSMVSRMNLKVIHDLEPLPENIKMFFTSIRGELTQQLKINASVIKENAVRPSAFSVSVFNTPPALASIILGLRGGYSAVYTEEGNFMSAVSAALGLLKSGGKNELLFSYADEPLPEEYKTLFKNREVPLPFAFALILTLEKESGLPEIPYPDMDCAGCFSSPHTFLKTILSFT